MEVTVTPTAWILLLLLVVSLAFLSFIVGYGKATNKHIGDHMRELDEWNRMMEENKEGDTP